MCQIFSDMGEHGSSQFPVLHRLETIEIHTVYNITFKCLSPGIRVIFLDLNALVIKDLE